MSETSNVPSVPQLREQLLSYAYDQLELLPKKSTDDAAVVMVTLERVFGIIKSLEA